jgi:hypothetical protein
MARRKQSNKIWLRRVVFFIGFPLIVWFAAFLLWFYWHDLRWWFAEETPRQPTLKAVRRDNGERREGASGEPPKSERPQEKILEEDRRKLEDILKRRN